MRLPADFITRTQVLPDIDFPQLETALQTESPVSIRMNSGKGMVLPGGEPVAWCETGYYLPERLSFTFDPLFHAGGYYVQEASSMFLEQAINTYVQEPVCCLDLCAAPGGKSTHLLSLLPEGSLLVSNEVIRSRSHILAENMAKWGNPGVIVTNNDPAEIGELRHLFDMIVTDVPCSGEGMFRKDPDSIQEWSEANVNLCAGRQRRILHDVWDALKPGGLLIYSTCTYNTDENEDNIDFIVRELGADALPVPLNDVWKVTGPLKYDHPVYRFLPHRTKGEGFFLAVLRKADGMVDIIKPSSRHKKEKGKALPPIPPSVKDWLSQPDAFHLEIQGEHIRAIPVAHVQTGQLIASSLRIVSAGIHLCEIKGKDLIPEQALALSTSLNRDIFPTVELGWSQAIQYLKKEALQLYSEAPKGYVLLTYKGLPLGFVKNLGNRANNLYPQEWRIRSGYLPEEVKLLEHL